MTDDSRAEQLKRVPLQKATPEKWPANVRAISVDEIGNLGIDPDQNIYWNGHPIEVRRPLQLSWWQKFGAAAVVIATVLSALGTLASAVADWVDP